MKLKLQIKLSAGLGILALLTGFLTLLALTDISHGREPDLSQEWAIVQASAVIFTVFIGLTLVTLKRVLPLIKD